MNRRLSRTIFLVVAFGALSQSAQAQPILIGCTGTITAQPETNKLVDVNPMTGLATNPRDIGIAFMAGIAIEPSTGNLFGLTTVFSNPANSLVTISMTTGLPTLIGITGLPNIVEADLAFNPLDGFLYGIQDTGPLGNQRNLFRLNPINGAGTIVGSLATQGDFSSLAFSPSGMLYSINSSGATNSILHTIDPNAGAILNSTTLNLDLGSTVGMTFDPLTGVAYVADGGTNATNALYTLDIAMNTLNLSGPIGISGGISGLSIVPVPEPTSFTFTSTVLFLIARRFCRKRKT